MMLKKHLLLSDQCTHTVKIAVFEGERKTVSKDRSEISQSDILLFISIARNKKLADVFYRLHLIEAYGTGMPKIMEAYKEHGKPHIEISDNAFKIT